MFPHNNNNSNNNNCCCCCGGDYFEVIVPWPDFSSGWISHFWIEFMIKEDFLKVGYLDFQIVLIILSFKYIVIAAGPWTKSVLVQRKNKQIM